MRYLIFDIFIKFLFTYIFSYTLLSFFLKKKYLFSLDIPNIRSSHIKNTPSSGGFVFLLSGIFVYFLSGNLIPLACTPVGIVGYFDDKFNINAFVRFVFQILTCSLLLFINDKLIFDSFFNIIITSFLIISGTALINFINFMDGIDGLVVSLMIFIFLPFAILQSNYFLVLIASMTAFLFFNWHPAKIFMGDLGSTYLGAIFFGILVSFDSSTNSLLNLIIASPLLFDSSSCIFRRFFAKENIFKAHNKHIYQRLFQSGLKHSEITIIYALPTVSLTILFFFKNYTLISLNLIMVLILGIYLERFVCTPFEENSNI